MRCNHTIHSGRHHLGWDRSIAPVLTVRPGETVALGTVDASGGQLGPGAGLADLAAMDPGRVNPVTGPIFVEGAEPGDALTLRFREFTPSGWGWTANIPGFGLLAEQFPEPALHLWSYDAGGTAPMLYGPGARVPLRPFVGTVGLAPAAAGPHSVIPPRRVGGNLDIRDMTAGTLLHLPVEVPGALLSLGDTHAAQGDGEVCGTAVESPMEVAVEIGLAKGAGLAFPRFETPPSSPGPGDAGAFATTGVGPDLMQAARDAVSAMIDWLAGRTGMAPVEAYMLCSVCGDLRISEIVDAPNWVVSFYFPRAVLD
ncbi:acetamidase/formamidase family protein [Paralimibaculum aggregatum]|uniref:Acetamidase/formamidase family protein n=1 Tax=Paralimibaculum aggregatum TaxID=3036245 RepID=A0ABQ6LI90_9RHOB|nr:acetamidase/formamidase family protein [Limibaculum sp. NKW23]GMG82998.1 acetamidase/formamidase family protein [Limibaculum sp. NKW23]